ncbi:hypothetical protein SAMCCGM7_pC0555 (plasmid) [Sinorhizobium americanum CCGM7]|nr:hypothetical protein SAMCCGM7_pC0555 [Sinorhizobium americanum CCGM7]
MNNGTQARGTARSAGPLDDYGKDCCANTTKHTPMIQGTANPSE